MVWLIEEDLEKWDEHWMPVSLRCRQSQTILSSSQNSQIFLQGLPTAFPICDKVRELGRGVASLAPQVESPSDSSNWPLPPQFGSEWRRADCPAAALGEPGSRGCRQPQGGILGQVARGDHAQAFQQGRRRLHHVWIHHPGPILEVKKKKISF